MPMVDVTAKPAVRRRARAAARVALARGTLRRIRANAVPKGNVLETARAAALLAVKRTPALLPHCHPIAITGADVSFRLLPGALEITAETRATDRTGVEMEALTAACVAALTVYDMCKGIDSNIRIEAVRLLEKAKEPV